MRNNFHMLCALLLAFFLFSCVSSGTGPPEHSEIVSETEVDEEKSIALKKSGGLKEIAPDSEEALSTYSFLKEELASSHPDIELLGIKKAFSQVVAGHNIILVCEYKVDENKENMLLYAKVYYDLKKNRSLVELVLDYSGEKDPAMKE